MAHGKPTPTSVLMRYQQVNYHWNHSNLEQGMAVGYAGTLRSIQEFQEKQEAVGAFSHVQSIL